MSTLTILPFKKHVTLNTDESVLKALRRSGFEIEGPCNGQGSKYGTSAPGGKNEFPGYVCRESEFSGIRFLKKMKPPFVPMENF